jgi:uncharacterized protein (DUF305 family)
MIRLVTLTTAFLIATAAYAQDHGAHGTATAAPALPAICLENAASHDMPAMPAHNSGPHGDLMAGMDKMNADMMAGATATDLDVAFICSMIPHHQGAIDMAKAELAAGDEEFPRDLAEAIIAAQEEEIAQMLAWLASR